MKEACGYAKESIKNRQVSEVSKQWVLDARLKKRREKKRIKHSPCFLTFVSKFKREKIPRSIVELGLATINIHLIPYTCTS
jgi:hypothetical protein